MSADPSSVEPPVSPVDGTPASGAAASPPSPLPLSPAPAPRGNGCKVVGCGCLLVAILVLALLVGGGIYLLMNWRSVASMPVRRSLVQSIEQMQLPQDQKQGLVQEMDRVFASFQAGEMSVDRLARVAGEVKEHPIFAIGAIQVFDVAAVQASGLGENEKQQARQQLARLSRGIYEGRIAWEQLAGMLEPMTGADENATVTGGRWTDAQVRETLAQVQREVDAAGIQPGEFQVDLAAEARRLVDRLLAEP